jgi:hypothetical protein
VQVYKLFLSLRGKHWLRVFESRVLRTVFGPNRDVARGEENYIIRRFTICAVHSVLLRLTLQGGQNSGTCITSGEGDK